MILVGGCSTKRRSQDIVQDSNTVSVCVKTIHTILSDIAEYLFKFIGERNIWNTALILKKTSHNSPCLVSGRVVQGRQQTGQVPLAGVVSHQHPVAQPAHSTIDIRASNERYVRISQSQRRLLLRHY